MKRSIYRISAFDVIRAVIIPALFTLAVIVAIVYGLHQTEKSSRAEGLRILEDSIRRAVVIAYAVEGRYPESINYIEENFGIHIDEARYVVHYQVFASNLMPDIMVFER